jgi:hypothetical protein
MDKISVADPKAKGRAVWLGHVGAGLPGRSQAMSGQHSSVRRLIEPVTDILKGPARPRSQRRPDLRRHGHPEGEQS